MTHLTTTTTTNDNDDDDDTTQADDLHVNFYDVMTTVVHAPAQLKDAVIQHVRPILEEWIGHVDTLDHTSTYGIRRYFNGSRCVRG